MACVLVTGGAGYIGSHTCVELLAAGHEVVVIDNLCNAKASVLERVERIAGRGLTAFYRDDVRDSEALERVFARHRFDAVIHFAALKAVAESLQNPLSYYDNNVGGSLALLKAMDRAGVRGLVFSSSATVYGMAQSMPIREDCPPQPINPYGFSKWMVEQTLFDLATSDARWAFMVLRYFNPVGAHPSGLIGEDPAGVPDNLMPYVSQVAVGLREELRVFGGDYPTPDGTGVRDYLHVQDLALGHVRALEKLAERSGATCLNLGTGRGHSVLELVQAFERACGRKLPFSIQPRRAGDVSACWADPGLAQQVLGWRAERSLDAMCEDAWRWQTMNPRGYADSVDL